KSRPQRKAGNLCALTHSAYSVDRPQAWILRKSRLHRKDTTQCVANAVTENVRKLNASIIL
ncbi:MAG TPA: hypothetical protein PKM51_08430, partial [Chitinophagales bacterium]|nr:hypothetical protein [Chitinophagales bacterium]